MKISKDQIYEKEEGIIYDNFVFHQYNLSKKLIEKYKPSSRSIGKHIRKESGFSKGVA